MKCDLCKVFEVGGFYKVKKTLKMMDTDEIAFKKNTSYKCVYGDVYSNSKDSECLSCFIDDRGEDHYMPCDSVRVYFDTTNMLNKFKGIAQEWAKALGVELRDEQGEEL